FPARLEHQAFKAIVAKAQSIAEMTAFSISSAVYFEDIETIEDAFESARQNKDLVYMVVLNSSGDMMTAFGKDKAEQVNFIQAKEHNYISRDGRIYEIMTPVRLNNQEIGQLYLGLSLTELRAEISRSRTTIALVSLTIFAIGMIVVFAISAVLTGPLSHIVKTVEQIAQGDLSHRAPVSSQDEVGQLARAFNLMVENLESAYSELENANRHLEKRVEERTKELQQEINDRKRAEEAIRRSEEQYRGLVETMHEFVTEIRPDGTFQFVNQPFSEATGYSVEALIGTNFFSYVHSDDMASIREHCHLLQKKKLPIRNCEYRFRTKDGSYLHLLTNGDPIYDAEGNLKAVLQVSFDITERKRAEEERAKLEEQLRQSQKIEAVGKLAGGVAHDFNNLLTAISGYTELLLSDLGPDHPMRADLGEIKKATDRAASLTHQLLAFSRRQPLQPKVLDLNALITNLYKMLQRLIGEDIELITILEPDLSRVKADPGQLEQVIMNLAVNARDAMPHGGHLTIKTQTVTLDNEACKLIPEARPGRFVCLSLEDTGIGMDKATLAQIFEPFFSTKAPGEGTGLGLSVVYGIVKQHEGWITVDSVPGQGSIFTVYLPAFSIETKEKTEDRIPLQKFQGRGERILLVEDEPVVREFTTRVLNENGYQVFEATSAQKAWDIFQQEKENFDLVFSDVVLPDKNGLQLVEQLLSRNPRLRVLLSSGYTDHKSQWPLIRERGFHFLQKPYLLTELLRAVREVIDET
ncbi:MAG: PAS domain S-box protein, partial [candidate division KSB1 bacterium]|nr:PAS domain S-box protein [candidate division KSB1 bacterium]